MASRLKLEDESNLAKRQEILVEAGWRLVMVHERRIRICLRVGVYLTKMWSPMQ
jgi:hypothetical protein